MDEQGPRAFEDIVDALAWLDGHIDFEANMPRRRGMAASKSMCPSSHASAASRSSNDGREGDDGEGPTATATATAFGVRQAAGGRVRMRRGVSAST